VVALIALGSTAAAGRGAARVPPASSAPQEPGSSVAAPREATLGTEDRETLGLIREWIGEEDLERARALLGEVVAGLEGPAAGAETQRVAFLLELDRMAQELGSLRESEVLRSSVLELRNAPPRARPPGRVRGECSAAIRIDVHRRGSRTDPGRQDEPCRHPAA
jgi:hypothetical protein